MHLGNNGPRPPIKHRCTVKGQWLTDTRLHLGLRVHDVANDLRVNQGRVSEAEIGLKDVKPEFMAALDAYYAARLDPQ